MKFRTFLTALTAIFAISVAQTATAGSCGGGDHSHGDGYTVVDKAAADGNFSTLIAAVEAAGLQEVLSGHGPFTVFAPTDAAFAALPAGTVESLLLPENKDQLVAVLTYHVVPGAVTSDQLVGQRLSVATVQGSEVHIDARDGVKVDGANVTTADIIATNGVVHVIDSVILP